MDVSIIVAKSCNNVIGRDNKLPWRIPEDLKLFKRLTMDKALIMGRKTFESIGKALPGRLNIVLSRNPEFRAADCTICRSLSEGIEVASKYAKQRSQTEIMVIGGSAIFEEALPATTRIYLTNIPLEFDGDAFFPMDLMHGWYTKTTETHQTTVTNIPFFEFSILSKQLALAAE